MENVKSEHELELEKKYENVKPELVELFDDIEDTKEKLEDCMETLRSGKELDSTQQAFLRSININVDEY